MLISNLATRKTVVLIGLISSLTACVPEVRTLPFKIMSEGQSALSLISESEYLPLSPAFMGPAIVFITSEADEQTAARLFTDQDTPLDVNEMANFDFNKDVAVLAYLGTKGHGGFEIHVKNVVREGNILRVEVSTVEPAGGDAVITYPYCLIRLDRDDLRRYENLELQMWNGDKLLAESNYSRVTSELVLGEI